MDISGVTNGKINWGEVLGKTLDDKGLSELKDATSVVLDGDNVTITIRDTTSGANVQRTIAVPELPAGSFESDLVDFLNGLADDIDAMVDELQQLAVEVDDGDVTPEDGFEVTVDVFDASVGATGGEPKNVNAEGPKGEKTEGGEKTGGDKKVEDDKKADGGKKTDNHGKMTKASMMFYTIYDLINLMQQLGQLQRNNARQIRYGELEAQIASIKSQAEHQRQGALLGLIASAVTCVAQAGLIIGTTIAGAKGLSEQSKTASGQQLEQANLDVKTSEIANRSAGAAKDHYDSLAAKNTTAANKVNGMVNFEESEAVQTAEAEVTRTDNNLKALKAAGAGQEAEITNADGTKTKVTVTEEMITNAEGELKAAKTKCAEAKVAFLDKAVNDMDAKYATAREKTSAAENEYLNKRSSVRFIKNSKEFKPVQEARDAQAQLGEERTLLKAKVAQLKAEIKADCAKAGINYDAGLANDLHEAHHDVKAAKNQKAVDRYETFLNNKTQLCMSLQQLHQTVAALGQSVAHFLQANEEAKATEDQAKQKELEQFRDETNQLFQQAQEVINNIRQLLQAIIQAEAQSNDQIIRV